MPTDYQGSVPRRSIHPEETVGSDIGMSGWQILILAAVCVAGVLVFLKLVANEVALADEHLRRLERRTARSFRTPQGSK